MKPVTEPQPARTLRAALLSLAALGVLITPFELLILGHIRNREQLIPFALLAMATAAIVLVLLRPNALTLRWFQVAMVLVTLGSLVGVFEHVKSNLLISVHLFHLSGIAALWDAAVNGKAPLLAPGILAQVGLLGLAYTFRHPAWAVVLQRVEARNAAGRSERRTAKS